jgi:hypothetical protein
MACSLFIQNGINREIDLESEDKQRGSARARGLLGERDVNVDCAQDHCPDRGELEEHS